MFGIQGSISVSIAIDGFEIPFDISMIRQLNVFSALNQFLPSFDLLFNDKASVLTEFLSLSGGETIKLTYGVTGEEARSFEFVNSSFNAPDMIPMHAQGAMLRMSGMLKLSSGIFRPARYRSFRDMTSAAVVEQIMGELDIPVRVEQTDDAMTWLQPGWTNAQMIRDLARYAVTPEGNGAFVYGINRSGKMLYFSQSGLYRQPVAFSFRGIVHPDDFANEDRLREGMIGIEPINRQALVGITGGFGTTVQSFDWDTKSWVETAVTPDAPPGVRQPISDKVNIRRDDVDPMTRLHFSGRVDSNQHPRWTEAQAYDRVFRRVGAGLKLMTMIRGNPLIRIGDKIRLQFASADPEIVFNPVYDGDWIVERIVDDVTSHGYWTKLISTRDGINQGEAGALNLVDTGAGLGEFLGSLPI